MKIAINTHYSNKISNGDDTRSTWRHFNGSFTNITISPEQWLDHIYAGHPYAAQHSRYRKTENFLCAQHLATDHDTGDHRSSFSHLLNNPFVMKYAYAVHTTPSHTDETPRARVIYLLDRPIKNRDRYALLAESLCHHFEDADKSVKDPCRFFFGHKRGDIHWLGNTLHIETAAELLVVPFKVYQQSKPKPSYQTPIHGNGSLLQEELNKVALAPDGQKYYTLLKVARTLGGYIGGGHLNETEVRASLINTIKGRDIKSLGRALGAIDYGITIGRTQPLHVADEWELMGISL